MEVRQNRTLDELYRRRRHTSGAVQHDPYTQVFPIHLERGQGRLPRKQKQLERRQSDQEADVYQGDHQSFT